MFAFSLVNFNFANLRKMNKHQNSIGKKLLNWYENHGRDLPFRQTKDPYKIWICEIIFQQTRIQQGIGHYKNFIKRFPNVQELYHAKTDEVLLYWKGLGYYSRALNLHRASVQIMEEFGGEFPQNYNEILQLKGVGKYTAAAISSICFGDNFLQLTVIFTGFCLDFLRMIMTFPNRELLIIFQSYRFK